MKFFSLDASEASIKKDKWNELFLPGWNGYQTEAFSLPPTDRESIIFKRCFGTAYDLAVPIDFENPCQESESLAINATPVSFPLFAIYSFSLLRKIIYYEDFYINALRHSFEDTFINADTVHRYVFTLLHNLKNVIVWTH